MIQFLAPILVMLQAEPGTQQPNPDWNCDDPIRQQEMNWCAAREYAVADAALNVQWGITSQTMKRRDESQKRYDPDGDGRPGYFQTLLEAQRAWIEYRDAHCRSDGYYARGGSMEPLLVSTCKTALTKERTRQLAELAGDPD